MKRVYVINGPNLNLLGQREKEIYGSFKLKEVIAATKKAARKKGIKIRSYQSNHEGKIIDKIHSLVGKGYLGLIINPGALTHYSYSIRDAIKASNLKAVEVHLSDIDKRDEFRKTSVIKDVCIDQIKGFGPSGYVKALDVLLRGLITNVSNPTKKYL